MLCLCFAVGADKQCELTCRPASYRFYVRQAEQVRDGTPCFNVSSNDVCVEGRCLVSGFKYAFVKFSLQMSQVLPFKLHIDKVQKLALFVSCLEADLSLALRFGVSPIFFLLPYSGLLFSVSFPLSLLWTFTLWCYPHSTLLCLEGIWQTTVASVHKQRWNNHWQWMWNVNQIGIAILRSVP